MREIKNQFSDEPEPGLRPSHLYRILDGAALGCTSSTYGDPF